MGSRLLPLLRLGDEARLRGALNHEATFHSPVTDYRGPEDVAHILLTSASVLDSIEPQREFIANGETVTMIAASYRGHRLSGVFVEAYDHAGRIESATLLLRPLSTLQEAIAGMRLALARSALPSER